MKKLILLLIIASAFASGIKAQKVWQSDIVYVDQSAKPFKIGDTINLLEAYAEPGNEYHPYTPPPDPDTINYIAIYTQSSGLRSTQKIAGFKTQSSLSSFLNENIDDATTVMIYDVRTKKPMTATFSTVDVEKVVKERVRKWNLK